jgi:hypothetical protein
MGTTILRNKGSYKARDGLIPGNPQPREILRKRVVERII